MIKTSGIVKLISLAWIATTLVACGGGASTESNQSGATNTGTGSLISANTSAEVIAYEKEVWQKLSSSSRCGSCHGTGGQSPQFVNGESIEVAYAEALSFVRGTQVANLASPNDSLMVSIVRNGHKQVNGKSQACWLATDEDCANAIRDYINAWNGQTSGTAAVKQGVVLVAPSPLRDIGSSKNYPADSSSFGTLVHTPVLTAYCSGCHTSTAANPQSPYFASNDVNASYLAAQQKMDLLDPANSRFVLRLRDQFHNCWTSDCAADAQEMEDAIQAFADSITQTQVDPSLIVSKAMKLLPPEAIIATGGERHAVNQIALWEFKTGSAATAYDTSGVEPLMNLSLSGDYSWAMRSIRSVERSSCLGSTCPQGKPKRGNHEIPRFCRCHVVRRRVLLHGGGGAERGTVHVQRLEVLRPEERVGAVARRTRHRRPGDPVRLGGKGILQF